jgi:hypothetical protein
MQRLMKSMLFFMVMTVFGAALAVVPAHAQSSSRVLVNIPFDFSVGNTPLKAGSYTIKELKSGVLALSSNDGQEQQFVLTVRGDSPNPIQQPHLVFKRYGTEAFLNKAFLSADDDCNQLPKSSRERNLIRRQASGEELSLLIQPVR